MEMEQETSELNVLREKRPSQLYPKLERLPSMTDQARFDLRQVVKKRILTLLGGFIVCLSFGSGKKFRTSHDFLTTNRWRFF